MSFTPIAIEGLYVNPDGSAAGGIVGFQLNHSMTNDGERVQGAMSAFLDNHGRITSQLGLAFVVFANDDDGTEPTDPAATYYINPQIDGWPTIAGFYATVPHDATITEPNGSIELDQSVLTLGQWLVASSMVGQPVTGPGLPDGTTVLSIDTTANTLQLSEASTSTETGQPYVIGGAVDMATLDTGR